ncbi:MAG: hypothetical protein U0T68_14080 [Ferruginibacter sp.]|jgi:hypothetical protein
MRFFSLHRNMRIILSILFLLTVSLYVLPVKQILKDGVCVGVTDSAEKVEDGKKKEKPAELFFANTNQPLVCDNNPGSMIINHGNIPQPLLDVEAPPPNRF